MHTCRFTFVFALVTATSAWAQPNLDQAPMAPNPPEQKARQAPLQAPEPPRQGTPRELLLLDVNRLVTELNNLPTHVFGSLNVDGRLGYYGAQEWADQMRPLKEQGTLVVDNIEIVSIDDKTALVKSTSHLRPNQPGQGMEAMSITETTQWRFGTRSVPGPTLPGPDIRWRIVPPQVTKNFQDGVLNYAAFELGQMPGTAEAKNAQEALTNLKQLGLATMQFVLDYDEYYAFDAAHIKSALRPYSRTETIFSVPGTKEEFAFNDNLSGRSLAAVEEAARTVLFYDGHDSKLNFRFDGKAAIGFTDGHCKLVTPEESTELIWQLQPQQ